MSGQLLLKIRIPLHGAAAEAGVDSETVWAKPHGDSLFELHSIPFFAYNLNLHDIVECDPATDPPSFIALRRPSGHETLRLVFPATAGADLIASCISALRERGALVEAASAGRFWALSFPSWPELVDATAYLQTTVPPELLSYESGFRQETA